MNATIQQKEQEIVEKQAQIDESFTLLQQRLRAIFKSGNMSGLQMLLDTDEYADYLIKSKMMERISENDQELMDGLEAEMQQINAEKEQVVAQKAEVEQQEQEIAALKAQADEKKNEMDSLYSQVNAVVKQLQSDISYTEQQLKEKKAQEEALNQQIADLINSTESTGKYGGGTMFWPVPAVQNISSGFGPRWGTMHRGIDISEERFRCMDKMWWRRPTGWSSMPTRPTPGAAVMAIMLSSIMDWMIRDARYPPCTPTIPRCW